ncbi:hypothetical protein Syun_003261 [Stephania yunnanensis]|uniref:Uncharacterized protein n=1 Tax=Stephania yunnanensis TaxID=152371 RepID=A0AAP0L4Q0_9MAGN
MLGDVGFDMEGLRVISGFGSVHMDISEGIRGDGEEGRIAREEVTKVIRDVYENPKSCKPTTYSWNFKISCPNAYSYAYDDPTSVVACSGGNYLINQALNEFKILHVCRTAADRGRRRSTTFLEHFGDSLLSHFNDVVSCMSDIGLSKFSALSREGVGGKSFEES